MSHPNLAAADPIVAALAWLRQHSAVLAESGGDPTRVDGVNEAPYPRWVITDSAGGDDRDLVYLTEPEISLATYGDLDGTPGKAELRRLHYVALAALKEITSAPEVPGRGVVSRVTPSSSALWSPEPLTRQPAWRSTVLLRIRPPREMPTRLVGHSNLTA